MQTVQIVLDTELLQAADEAARLTKQNRSALVRDALRKHLQMLEIRAKEERERKGYQRLPQALDDGGRWEAEAVWPQD